MRLGCVCVCVEGDGALTTVGPAWLSTKVMVVELQNEK